MNYHDKILILDIWIGKQTLKDRHRVKRVAPIIARVAWAAGRALFRSLAKSTPRITRSGGKLTKQFFKKGGFETAKRDFHRFKPANVKQFTGKNVSNPKRFNVAQPNQFTKVNTLSSVLFSIDKKRS